MSEAAEIPGTHEPRPHYVYAVHPNTSIRQYQDFVRKVYGLSNDRNYELWDMMSNVARFTMRGLKGIRKGNHDKAKTNLLISLSWFTSLLDRLHIDLERIVWKRFPGCCSYCGQGTCACKKDKTTARVPIAETAKQAPATLDGYQRMLATIYPPDQRTLEHAGVHLAEETGELSEAILAYRGGHGAHDFENIKEEAADYFSCLIGVFNSLSVSIAPLLAEIFTNNCHVCHEAPCACTFTFVAQYKS